MLGGGGESGHCHSGTTEYTQEETEAYINNLAKLLKGLLLLTAGHEKKR
jgi:hypothetical protein